MARLALVGADPHDDEDLRARKALLVLISVLILPVAALWGVLYLAFGSPVGVVPFVYFGILLGAIGSAGTTSSEGSQPCLSTSCSRGGAWLLVSLQLPHRDVRWQALLPGAVLVGSVSSS